eukprot:472964-Amphidinium_carterae.3
MVPQCDTGKLRCCRGSREWLQVHFMMMQELSNLMKVSKKVCERSMICVTHIHTHIPADDIIEWHDFRPQWSLRRLH